LLPIQRKAALIEYLSKHGGGTVKELSQLLQVSEMTVRRDLKQLEAQGMIIPSHGGVVFVQSLMKEPALNEKAAKNKDIKDRIAAYAVEHFVSEGDVIMLEGGTTIAGMAPYLRKFRQLTILTNGLDTLNRLRDLSGENTVLCCGGTLRGISGTFVGPVAQSFFKQFHANTVFLSALGFAPETGFTDPNIMDTEIKKAMIHSSQRTIMLIDSTKFGVKSLTTFVTIQDVDVVVTDSGISEQMRRYLENQNVELHVI